MRVQNNLIPLSRERERHKKLLNNLCHQCESADGFDSFFFFFFFFFGCVPFFTVNDDSIISRSCFWENIYAPSDECMNMNQNPNVPSAITTEFCETCSDDGCNSGIQHGATALLVVISALVSKIFLF